MTQTWQSWQSPRSLREDRYARELEKDEARADGLHSRTRVALIARIVAMIDLPDRSVRSSQVLHALPWSHDSRKSRASVEDPFDLQVGTARIRSEDTSKFRFEDWSRDSARLVDRQVSLGPLCPLMIADHRLVLEGDHRSGNVGSGRAKDNGARRCSWRPSAINSAATVDISHEVPRHSRRNATTARPWRVRFIRAAMFRGRPPSPSRRSWSHPRSQHRRGSAKHSRVVHGTRIPRSPYFEIYSGRNALFSLTISGNNFLQETASSFSSCLTYDVRSRRMPEAEASCCTVGRSRRGSATDPGVDLGLVVSRKHPASMMEAETRGSSPRRKARCFFVLATRADRARARAISDSRFVVVDEAADRILVPGSNLPSFLPSCLPSCLPFVSALCTLRGTSGSCLLRPPADGSRGLDSPPSSPVAPSESLPPLSRPGYASWLAS